MSIASKMIEYRASAQLARCQIKEWKLDRYQALKLANEISIFGDYLPRYEAMLRGDAHALGARIRVV